jgi:MSHA biogenesis protein MshL
VRTFIFTIAVLSLSGCGVVTPKLETYDLINAEIGKAVESKTQPAKPDAVSAALLPPLKIDLPKAREPLEERFSLTFDNVSASQFFIAIVSGTRYNMLVHPEVAGTISVNLKDVTLFEALDAIRELYGYDYKVEGTRIFIRPLTLQTRVFHVNYMTGIRKGSSDIRVTSGSTSGSTTAGTSVPGAMVTPPASPGSTTLAQETSKISTSSTSDFWSELKASLESIVGSSKDGRSVVISPQSGVIVVRAMPEELRNVAAYLNATQISVDRQVILEAKIMEVQLNDNFQAGINWASFASFTGNNLNRSSIGVASPGSTLKPLSPDGMPSSMSMNTMSSVFGVPAQPGFIATPGAALGAASQAAASLFGLAFQTSNFAALISFLESQGTVHVLSSPRIATMNNQKAVLKIGTDELFVTNVLPSSTTVAGSAATNVTAPSVTLQSYFSGVVLDVTPQIDERGNIILHIRPSVTLVNSVNKIIDLGVGGLLNLPVPSSNTSETDSVVRGRDGHIIAIGGLMRQFSISDRSQVPGAGDAPVVGALFRNTSQAMVKRELVILLKPTIVKEDSSWTEGMMETQHRIQALDPRSATQQR